jgi:OmcA/MtrC family decaheme c-type cytochrome
VRAIACGCLLFSAALFSSSDTPVFTRRDKAFFANPNVVAFVRPGLALKIVGASAAADGTITVQYTVTDPAGLPLDLTGVTTPGVITPSYIASYIAPETTDYIPITSRAATGTVSGSIRQAGTDAGGRLTNTGDGQYTYVFATKLPATMPAGSTITVGMYASRNLTEFDLGTNSANAVFSFTTTGAAPAAVHDIVHTQTCNKCHDPLMAHGGARREVALCVLCHNPGGNGVANLDPDTGNTIDLKVMAHKIHMGEDLPSVQAGKPYQIIGFNNAVIDFSEVVFPADARNCQMCHETGAAPQGGTAPPGSMTANTPPPVHGNLWITHPTRAACGACHDNVNFATGENHANLPQTSDNLCTTCHFPQGELPFDLSILGAHTIPQFAPGLPGVVFTLQDVTNRLAGQQPTVTFTLKDKSGAPIAPSSMTSLNLVLAGPTSDYQQYVSESATRATGSNGTYTYTFTARVPAGATGSYSIGIEGYRNQTLLAGTNQEQVVRDAGDNKVINFSVDNSVVAPHAVEVATANCNQCHYKIQAHGMNRNQVEMCLLCHNPNTTDVARRPATAGAPMSVDFPVLIHRIHQGEESEAGGHMTPYVVYGFNGSVNDFSKVRFPGDLRDCAKCHVNDSEGLPLPAGRVNVTNPRAWYSPMGPTAAACTACHTSRSTAAHTNLNTSPTFGESCDVCHGRNADFSVDKVHARTL